MPNRNSEVCSTFFTCVWYYYIVLYYIAKLLLLKIHPFTSGNKWQELRTKPPSQRQVLSKVAACELDVKYERICIGSKIYIVKYLLPLVVTRFIVAGHWYKEIKPCLSGIFFSSLAHCHSFLFLVNYPSCTWPIIWKKLWPLFMHGVQLSQGYRTTTKRQFTSYHSLPRSSCYLFNRPLKDERLGWPWSHPAVLNPGPLDWESSALTTRTLLHMRHISAQSAVSRFRCAFQRRIQNLVKHSVRRIVTAICDSNLVLSVEVEHNE